MTTVSPILTNSALLKEGQGPSIGQLKLKTKQSTLEAVQREFEEVESKYKKIGGGILGASALAVVIGSLKSGWTFPAKFLQIAGDAFGSIASIAAPVFIVGNEIKNHKLLKGADEKEFKVFDDLRKGFYRCASLGFTPFIFEPFVNPEKFGKSIFHKIATVANIPNLIFTGYSWGLGNFKALLLWGMRTVEQFNGRKALAAKNDSMVDFHNKRAQALYKLYDGCERSAVIGSIANPTLQGLRQWADSMSFFFSKNGFSTKEFFENPFLGVSRLISLVVGVPETFAKGVDSVVRVVKERENLKPALPKFLKSKQAFELAGKIEKELCNSKGTLNSIRHYAEIVFHTLSPLSMFALFAPLLGEKHISEEAQSQGGVAGALNKVIGGYGKTLTVLFTGLYVTLARLPQAIFQLAYFGKKVSGKFADKDVSVDELNTMKKNISNSSIISGISNVAKSCIEKLVPDFYTAEHDHGYLTYEQIQAKYSFEQAEQDDRFKEILQVGAKITSNQKDEIVKSCINYVEKDAEIGRHILSSEERNNIKKIIGNKIENKINPGPKRKTELPFIGAEFLATYIFKLFDLKTRLQSIDYRSDHHNMTTAYDNDERRISFEYELLPVVAKCTKGLGNTINRLFGIAA